MTSGMRIWKLYNHGFFVRTPTVSFTFDIVPGVARVPGFAVDMKVLERIADQSDATFISHLHGDHASEVVSNLFADRKKPVIAPEGLWIDKPIAGLLTYPWRSAKTVHEIPIQNQRRILKVVSYPGHQGAAITNNVNLVITPEGVLAADFEWIDNAGADRHIDVLPPNWTPDIKRMARGVNPELIITGHENEMGHTVDHRRTTRRRTIACSE